MFRFFKLLQRLDNVIGLSEITLQGMLLGSGEGGGGGEKKECGLWLCRSPFLFRNWLLTYPLSARAESKSIGLLNNTPRNYAVTLTRVHAKKFLTGFGSFSSRGISNVVVDLEGDCSVTQYPYSRPWWLKRNTPSDCEARRPKSCNN